MLRKSQIVSITFFLNNELTLPARISPIYLGLFLNMGIAFLLQDLFVKDARRAWHFVVLVILLLFQLLIFSLSSVLAIVAMIVISGIYAIVKRENQKRRSTIITLLILLIVGLTTVVSQVKPLRERITSKLEYHFEDAHISYWSGTTMRLGIWECALDALHKTPIYGNGTGDANDALMQSFKRKGFLLAEYLKLNAHNQYIQSILMHGILGALMIVVILVLPAIKAIRDANLLMLFFVTTIGLGFLSESLLSVQKGTVFFSMFYSLLSTASYHKE